MESGINKNLLLRLRRIEGQVRGVQRMIEDGQDCNEIMNQITAIKAAVQQVGILVFENHARECIYRSGTRADDESFDELVKMMSRFIK